MLKEAWHWQQIPVFDVFFVVEYKNIFIKSIIYIFKFLYKLFVVVGCILIENSYQALDILGYVYEKKR